MQGKNTHYPDSLNNDNSNILFKWEETPTNNIRLTKYFVILY
jgi:hypothetical protein